MESKEEKIGRPLDAGRYTTEQLLEQFKKDQIEADVGMKIPWGSVELVKLTLNDKEIAELESMKMEDTTAGGSDRVLRGLIAEDAVEYVLRKRKLVFDRNRPMDKFTDLGDFIPMFRTDFLIKTKAGTDIAIEVKSRPEGKSKFGYPFNLIFCEGETIDADYIIAVKFLEEPKTDSCLAIWGYTTQKEALKQELIENDRKHFRMSGTGRLIDLNDSEIWHPIKELWEMLEKDCLTWGDR